MMMLILMMMMIIIDEVDDDLVVIDKDRLRETCKNKVILGEKCHSFGLRYFSISFTSVV